MAPDSDEEADPGFAGDPAPSRSRAGAFAWRDWLFAAALLAAVLAAYQPAWNGGFLWDDRAHVTRPELRSSHGLWRIWFDVGATQQYYPLAHSVFWLEHRLWGDAPLGYHLVSILAHVAAALLAALVLRRLGVPGAYFAAAIFALHPVQVESVAWITELKNTLSAVFYLGAALAYLGFAQGRSRRLYVLALALFALGLSVKTVTATLPAALLLIEWWRRGRLSWRTDVLPLAPFFALGAGAGAVTAWVERALLGAEGAGFELTLVERGLLAGRAVWFYAAKLVWPVNLAFIYPRWHVSQAVWWQYLYPAALLAVLAVLWGLRRRWRGPLAGALFFVGTLFPALGFFNVYPFLFSFVADHFQYLASLGVITLAAAGAAVLLGRWRWWDRPAGYALCLAVLAALAVLTWRQSHLYKDSDRLYRATIERNRECWMAYNNLGGALITRGAVDEGVPLVERALALRPGYAEAHVNLGIALARRGRIDDAIAHYARAIALRPDYAEAHNDLALALAGRGQLDEAIAHYREALRIDAGYAGVHYNLAMALTARGQPGEAVAHLERALELRPDYPEAHNSLGIARIDQGHVESARAHFAQAVALRPEYADAHNNLGIVLARSGHVDAAIAHFRKALELEPANAQVRNNLFAAMFSRQRAGGGAAPADRPPPP